MRTTYAPFALLLCLCACAGASPTPDSRLAGGTLEEVKLLSTKAESILKKQSEQVWASWTEGAPLEIAKAYENPAALFSPESIAKIRRALEQTTQPEETRALTFLHAHFIGEYLALKLAATTTALANLESTVTFTLEGHSYQYRDLPRLLTNERSGAKRAALYEAATPAVLRLSALLRQKEEQLTSELQTVGQPSYEAYGSTLRQADFEALAQLAERVLVLTQAPYLEALAKLAQNELQLSVKQLRRADFLRLFRPRAPESYFPKNALLTRVNGTLKGLGIELDKIPNLKLDARDNPPKNPRPLALAIRVPSDVRLSVKPASGAHAEAEFLHELAHALQDAFTQPGRFELTRLGNPTAGETFASLFEGLLEDPTWLVEQTGTTEERLVDYLSLTSVRRLYFVRRTAAQLLYSLSAHRDNDRSAKAAYHSLMSRALGIDLTASEDERYVVDRDEFFAASDDLRAVLLAAQLEKQLKTRFGTAWWKSGEAGKLLKALWRMGNALSASELARLIGEDGIHPEALLSRVKPRVAGLSNGRP